VAVGVPEITPVLVEKLNPLGTEGEIDHEVAAPPELVGVRVEIAELTFPEMLLGEYEMDGALKPEPVTSIVMVAVEELVAFVAVTVYEVDADVALGVPEIIPVLVEKFNPAGTEGEIDQEATAPPELEGVNDVIALPTVPEIEVGE
jgi:hypothetical protein